MGGVVGVGGGVVVGVVGVVGVGVVVIILLLVVVVVVWRKGVTIMSRTHRRWSHCSMGTG